MPLTDEEYLEILRHLQRRLNEAEPELYERLAEKMDFDGTPRQRAVRYLRSLIGMMRERSSGSYASVLNLLNKSISTEDGHPIAGIRVDLSPQEQQLYQMDEIDLSELPDRSRLIEELQAILDRLTNEPDNYNESQQ